MEIKIFESELLNTLELKVNQFLKESHNKVLSIEYQTYTTPATNSSYGVVKYSALITLEPNQFSDLKDKLVLIRNRHCYGIVGTPTGVFLGNTELCIGDVVKFEACDVYNEGIGIIAMFGNVIGIQGIASTPLSIVETITSIVKSHKVLKSGETVWKGTGFTSCKLII